MIRNATVALVILLGGGSQVLAADAAALLRQGKDAYLDSRFEQSLELLRRARDLTDDAKLLAQIQLYLGVVRAVTGDTDAAGQEMRTALAYDPTVELSPDQFKPSIVALLQQVRQSMHGRLVVESNQTDAVVLVDGQRVGTVPLRRRVAVGRHRVEVHDASRRGRFSRQVVVALDQEVTVRAALVLTTPPPPGRPAPPERRRLWTWIAAGGSAAVLGAAVGLGASANADYEGYRGTMSLDRRSELRDEIEAKALSANVLFGVAGALAAAAVTLFFVEVTR